MTCQLTMQVRLQPSSMGCQHALDVLQGPQEECCYLLREAFSRLLASSCEASLLCAAPSYAAELYALEHAPLAVTSKA